MHSKYVLRYWFEWGGPILWPADDATRDALGYPVDVALLPLSACTVARIDELIAWHDTALNQEYPSDPGPWRQEECDRFNAAARDLLAVIQSELGLAFAIIDAFVPEREDPDLGDYQCDRKGFKRRR
jgi:hypothetical protein